MQNKSESARPTKARVQILQRIGSTGGGNRQFTSAGSAAPIQPPAAPSQPPNSDNLGQVRIDTGAVAAVPPSVNSPSRLRAGPVFTPRSAMAAPPNNSAKNEYPLPNQLYSPFAPTASADSMYPNPYMHYVQMQDGTNMYNMYNMQRAPIVQGTMCMIGGMTQIPCAIQVDSHVTVRPPTPTALQPTTPPAAGPLTPTALQPTTPPAAGPLTPPVMQPTALPALTALVPAKFTSIRPLTPIATHPDKKFLFNVPLESIIGLCKPLPQVRWKRVASELHTIGAANPTEMGHVIQQIVLEYWKCIVYPEVTKLLSVVDERGLRIEFSGGQQVQGGRYELLLKSVIRIKPDDFSQSLPVDGRMSPVYNSPQHIFEAGGATKLHAILSLTNKLLRFLDSAPEFRRYDAPAPATRKPTYDQPLAPDVLGGLTRLDQTALGRMGASCTLANSDLPIESIIGECKPEPERSLKTISQLLYRLSVAHPAISEPITAVIKQLEEEYEKHAIWQKLEQLMVLQWERGIKMDFSSGTTMDEGIEDVHILIELTVATANHPWTACQGARPMRQNFCVNAPTYIRAIAYAIDAAQRFLDSNPEFRWAEGGSVGRSEGGSPPHVVRPLAIPHKVSRYTFARNT